MKRTYARLRLTCVVLASLLVPLLSAAQPFNFYPPFGLGSCLSRFIQAGSACKHTTTAVQPPPNEGFVIRETVKMLAHAACFDKLSMTAHTAATLTYDL